MKEKGRGHWDDDLIRAKKGERIAGRAPGRGSGRHFRIRSPWGRIRGKPIGRGKELFDKPREAARPIKKEEGREVCMKTS